MVFMKKFCDNELKDELCIDSFKFENLKFYDKDNTGIFDTIGSIARYQKFTLGELNLWTPFQ
jgi:hypothetical protein